jgi:NAD(P)-dependent dehydrogenase (short-subunit alcohol dehydrogenase family)
MDMDGKVALITGGSNGIGEGVARHLAGQGAHVVLADIDDSKGAEVAEELGGRFIHTDVSEPGDSTAAVRFAVEEFGGLHLAHLNAGVTSWCSMGDDFDPEAYRRAMRINLDGVVYGIAAARPAIIASGGGTIVATASMAGLVPAPFDPIYAANKHAVVGLVRSIGTPTPPRGSRSMPCARRSPTPTSSRAPSRPCSTWVSPSSTSATSSAAFQRLLDSETTGSAGTPWPDGRASRSASGTPRAPASTDDRRPTDSPPRRLPRRGSTPDNGYCWSQQSGDGSRRGAHSAPNRRIG